MIPDKIKNIIKELHEKTLKNEFRWTLTSGMNGFQLILNTGNIVIDHWKGEKDNIAFVELSLYNKMGYKIDTFIRNNIDHKVDFDELFNFYNAAKTNHQKVDDDLSTLLNEVKNPHITKQFIE
jgi:hypothetical protein